MPHLRKAEMTPSDREAALTFARQATRWRDLGDFHALRQAAEASLANACGIWEPVDGVLNWRYWLPNGKLTPDLQAAVAAWAAEGPPDNDHGPCHGPGGGS